jgi:hypothetical protein
VIDAIFYVKNSWTMSKSSLVGSTYVMMQAMAVWWLRKSDRDGRTGGGIDGAMN